MTRSVTTNVKPKTAQHGKSHHGNGTMKFCAIDGEGVTLPDGEHRYVMLSVGQDTLTNPDGLDWQEIFSFLYEHYKPDVAYTGFFLGYDFTQWFKTLPENRAFMLLTREGIALRKHRRPHKAPHPVDCRDWQFDLLGGKRFRLRPKLCDCRISSCKCKHAPWMYVSDTGGFFQQSFLSVINPEKWPAPILSDTEYEIIETGKERRETAKLDSDMVRYNCLENEVLERVMSILDEGLRRIGVCLPPSKWFGPGQAAQEWLKDRAPTRSEIEIAVPQCFRDAARASYFAGWFELFIHGLISGYSWEYDINSAYPYIIAQLPCLLHGTWSRGTGSPPGGRFILVKATVKRKASGNAYIGAMLHRDSKGSICRPMITHGWYWLHELEAAIEAGCIQTIDYLEWMGYSPCDCLPPVREMADLYDLRLKAGKNSPLGKSAKLVYNSGYGKFAQSIGEPMFANAVYASLITAGCRTQILRAIASHPGGLSHVAMIATDAVYFLTPHPGLPVSDQLGDWTETRRSNLTIFKPGVYWDDSARQKIAEGKTPSFKARGVNARDLAAKIGDIDRQFAAWNGCAPEITDWITGKPLDTWPAVSFTAAFSMTTALQALRNGVWSQAGVVSTDRELQQSSNPYRKREGAYYDPFMDVYRSEPVQMASNGVESEPYDRRFGQEDPDNPFTLETQEKYGVTPDGYVSDELSFIFHGEANEEST